MSSKKTPPRSKPAASPATALIREATRWFPGGPITHEHIRAEWDAGIHHLSHVGLALNGSRKPRQSLLDAIFRLTDNRRLVSEVKAIAIAAYIAKHPRTVPAKVLIDDVSEVSR